MKKRLMTAALAATLAMTTAMSALAAGWQQDAGGWWYGTNADNTTYYTNGWQWIDGNGDGIAESYYFDANGYMLANTTTPDDYTVDGTGAWVENGVVQTKQVTASTVTTDTGRYTPLRILPLVVPKDGQLKRGFTFSRELYNSLRQSSTRAREVHYDVYGEDVSERYDIYSYNGEEFSLGGSALAYWSDNGNKGEWLVDNTKPDVDAGKTNIRFRYEDGTFAGYGFHTPYGKFQEESYLRSEVLMGRKNPDGTDKDWKTDPTFMKIDPTYQKYGYGKAYLFFSEDGYLHRNIYLDGVFADHPMMIGYNGTWLDRPEF